VVPLHGLAAGDGEVVCHRKWGVGFGSGGACWHRWQSWFLV